ncbi:MAG: molybdopterin-dependent oxidoreductase, partial [Melioribacteraceae bacterium]|nr:molybdopterin-dependent oxidoreductase [Melioribacteraceae bacterium]
VLARAALTAAGCYYIPHISINAKAVATNTPPNGAFRGFGGPQAIFALEMLIEKIANELKMNPADVRKINLIKEGETTATSQILKYSVSAHETVDDVIQRSDYQNKHKKYAEHNKRILEKILNDEYPKENSDQKLKGIGVSAFQHGAGFTGTGENVIKGKIRVEINNEGKPVIFSAQTEMGQGEQTAFQIILAKSLNINVDDVIMSEVNTDLVPNSGPTVASRSTMIVGSLLVDAGKEIINQLTDLLNSENPGWKYEEGSFINNGSEISFIDASKKLAGLKIEKQYEHPPIIKFDDINWIGDAYPVFSWAASVAEVEVDPVTFEIKVTKYYTTHDIGKAINKDQAEAQIQGGSLQGIGYAIYEKVKIENEHYDIKGFADYIIPTPTEMPVFDVKIMENPYPYGPFGAKGLGELPLVGGAPAVLSALWMIFGKEFNKIPVMPEDLLVLFNSNQKVG